MRQKRLTGEQRREERTKLLFLSPQELAENNRHALERFDSPQEAQRYLMSGSHMLGLECKISGVLTEVFPDDAFWLRWIGIYIRIKNPCDDRAWGNEHFDLAKQAMLELESRHDVPDYISRFDFGNAEGIKLMGRMGRGAVLAIKREFLPLYRQEICRTAHYLTLLRPIVERKLLEANMLAAVPEGYVAVRSEEYEALRRARR